MDNNKVYIPYGEDLIDSAQLNTKLADGITNYLNSKGWSRKLKERWLSAYQDITSRGITGASVVNGIWNINHKDEIDMSSKSRKEKDMYGDAAYYIQQQMLGLLTPKKKEENKDKQKYDNTFFSSDFTTHIGNSLYGGLSSKEWAKEWYDLDQATDGIRGTTNRQAKLAKQLSLYRDNIKNNLDKYDFESGPFKSFDEWNKRVDRALVALKNPEWNQEDKDALNSLGINHNVWLGTGENDIVTSADGRQMTRAEYNQLMAQLQLAEDLEKAKAQADAAKQKALQERANQWKSFKTFNLSQFNGRPLTSEESNVEYLNNLFAKGKWSADEGSQIRTAFKMAEKSGNLVGLSKEELAKLPTTWKGRGKYLRKINGMSTPFYYDTISKLYKYFHNGVASNPNSFLEVLTNTVNRNSEEYKRAKANARKLSEGFKTEDYLRMLAMALDLGAAFSAWAPVYGTAASAGLGLTSMTTNLAADAMDDSLSKLDVAKNAFVNTGLGLVGLVPGLGLASRTGKWLATLAKWAPRLLTLQAIKDTPEIYASIKKATTDFNSLTNLDWKNIAYGLSVAAGLSRGAAGYKNHLKYKPAFSLSTKKEFSVSTSKGKKIISEEQANKINDLNPKDENYHTEVKNILGLAKDETVSTKDLKILGKTLKTGGVKISENETYDGLSPRAKAYRESLEKENNQAKEKHNVLTKLKVKTNYDIYKKNTLRNYPDLNISERVKNIWNPLSDKNLKKRGIVVKENVPEITSSKTHKMRERIKQVQKSRGNMKKLKKKEFGGTLDLTIENFFKENNI